MLKSVLNKFVLYALLVFVTSSTFAQKRPIAIAVSSHFVNFTTDQYFPSEFWQIGIAKLSLGIPVTDNLSISPAYAFGKAKYPGGSKKTSYWDADLSLQYVFTKTKFQPFASIGGGVNDFNGVHNGTANAGLGINYWLSKNFALTAQTNYDYTPNFHNYWHNSIGVTFSINRGPGDADKDGVLDDVDACPSVKGTAATEGCPDQDGDGVKDSEDACLTEKGTFATKGCPDNDADGIANAQDVCPDNAGRVELNGCPDNDGDGVADKDDACPAVKGLAALKGCPDSDGDGITDKDDKCPSQKGQLATQGCPDADGDGIADANDNCPNQAGTLANKGCPEIKAEEAKQIESKLNIAAKLIQFETGKSVIRKQSFKELDEIISLMNQYQWTRFVIEGHTDNVGNAVNNKNLSNQRASAVKDYFVSKGITATRLDAVGYGSDKPLGSNNTAQGRTQNRRVEIHLAQ